MSQCQWTTLDVSMSNQYVKISILETKRTAFLVNKLVLQYFLVIVPLIVLLFKHIYLNFYIEDTFCGNGVNLFVVLRDFHYHLVHELAFLVKSPPRIAL